jgi:hypothetical protein
MYKSSIQVDCKKGKLAPNFTSLLYSDEAFGVETIGNTCDFLLRGTAYTVQVQQLCINSTSTNSVDM